MNEAAETVRESPKPAKPKRERKPAMSKEERRGKARARRRAKLDAFVILHQGTDVEVEDIRSGERRLLRLSETPVLARTLPALTLFWPGAGDVIFSLYSGCGVGEARHYRITGDGAKALGVKFNGRATSYQKRWIAGTRKASVAATPPPAKTEPSGGPHEGGA